MVDFEADAEDFDDPDIFACFSLFLVGSGGGFVAVKVVCFVAVAAGLVDVVAVFKGESNWDKVCCPPSLILLIELL